MASSKVTQRVVCDHETCRLEPINDQEGNGLFETTSTSQPIPLRRVTSKKVAKTVTTTSQVRSGRKARSTVKVTRKRVEVKKKKQNGKLPLF